MKKLGIIGSGNMGIAILNGIINSNIFAPNDIVMSDIDEKSLKNAEESYKIKTTTDNISLTKESEIVLLAVKPSVITKVLENIKNELTKDKIIISIAVGTSIETIQNAIMSKEHKIVRVMPNTPALVGEGMSVLCFGENFSVEEKNIVEKLFSSVGKVMVMSENMMNVVGAVSGSSPAFAFMFIEAMADAGVLGGLKRSDAYELAAQTLLGSAKLYLETKIHPAQLKDAVCSPAGTTIEGVKVLEENGFRASVIDAIDACIKKSEKF